MKYIDVSTAKHPNSFAIVDDEVFNEIPLYPRWLLCSRPNKTGLYIARQIRVNGKYVQQILSRYITKAKKGSVVITKDRNPLNCQKYNLVLCADHRFISRGQHKTRNKKTSVYKGVCWDKERHIWKATTYIANKQKYLGRYEIEIEAAKAYDKAATELFGIFACLNFPKTQDIVAVTT